MKKYRLIFYIIFFFFHVFLFSFSLYVDSQSENFGYLLKLQGYIQYMKYGTFFGLILVSIDFMMDKIEIGKLNKKMESLRNESNSWKAQMYDLQNAAKTQNQPEDAADNVASQEEEDTKP